MLSSKSCKPFSKKEKINAIRLIKPGVSSHLHHWCLMSRIRANSSSRLKYSLVDPSNSGRRISNSPAQLSRILTRLECSFLSDKKSRTHPVITESRVINSPSWGPISDGHEVLQYASHRGTNASMPSPSQSTHTSMLKIYTGSF